MFSIRIVLVAVVLAFAPAGATSAAAGDTLWLNASDGLRQAHAALLAGDPTQAARHAEAVLESARTVSVGAPPRALLYPAHNILCVCYRLERRWAEAKTQCDAAVSLARGDWRAYVNRAALAIEQGALAEAARDLARAEKRAPAGEYAIEANRELLRTLRAGR